MQSNIFNNKRNGVTRGVPEATKDLQWVANTSTLVFGQKDAVLVDTYMTKAANNKLIDWIRDHNVNLKYIYLTYAHAQGSRKPRRSKDFRSND